MVQGNFSIDPGNDRIVGRVSIPDTLAQKLPGLESPPACQEGEVQAASGGGGKGRRRYSSYFQPRFGEVDFHADIDGPGRVSQGPTTDEIHTGFSDLTDSFERHPSGGFE